MKKLAIKGHPTRGKEIIEILEMLGGKNDSWMTGTYHSNYYRISSNGSIYGEQMLTDSKNTIVFTIEEFIEKFPHKVGDIVKIDNIDYQGKGIIKELFWDKEKGIISYGVDDDGCINWWKTEDLQPYNEQERMEEKPFECIDFVRHPPNTNKFEIILGDYEIVQENDKCYAVKKKPKYPTTYEECCGVLGISTKTKLGFISCDIDFSNKYICDLENIANDLICLKICRDAYWKLENNWKPTKDDEGKTYSLFYNRLTDAIEKFNGIYESNAILDFQTAEMRDTFYENFKDLIEACKELL